MATLGDCVENCLLLQFPFHLDCKSGLGIAAEMVRTAQQQCAKRPRHVFIGCDWCHHRSRISAPQHALDNELHANEQKYFLDMIQSVLKRVDAYISELHGELPFIAVSIFTWTVSQDLVLQQKW